MVMCGNRIAVERKNANSKTFFRVFFVREDHSEAQAFQTPSRYSPVNSELTCFATMQDGHFSYLSDPSNWQIEYPKHKP
jgi:hypothetical protein